MLGSDKHNKVGLIFRSSKEYVIRYQKSSSVHRIRDLGAEIEPMNIYLFIVSGTGQEALLAEEEDESSKTPPVPTNMAAIVTSRNNHLLLQEPSPLPPPHPSFPNGTLFPPHPLKVQTKTPPSPFLSSPPDNHIFNLCRNLTPSRAFSRLHGLGSMRSSFKNRITMNWAACCP